MMLVGVCRNRFISNSRDILSCHGFSHPRNDDSCAIASCPGTKVDQNESPQQNHHPYIYIISSTNTCLGRNPVDRSQHYLFNKE